VLASREAHVRLYVNNEYDGLYTIVESIDKTWLQKNLGEDGGTLYKYDYNVDDRPYYFESRGSDSAAYVPSPFKPETNESDPQPASLVDMIRVINDAPAALFKQQIAQFLDMGQFIKHAAIEIFLADSDGFNGNWGMNNFYLYRYNNQNLYKFIPWDKSEAFKDGPTYPIFHNIYDVPEAIRNRLTMRVLNDPQLRTQFLDTLAECARSAAEPVIDTPETAPPDTRGWLEREVEREYAQIRDAALADTTKTYTNEEFEAAVEAMRVFARERSAFVTSQVAQARP